MQASDPSGPAFAGLFGVPAGSGGKGGNVIIYDSARCLLHGAGHTYTLAWGLCGFAATEMPDTSAYAVWLHEQELALAMSYAYEKRRTSYVLGRLSAKAAITAMTGFAGWPELHIQSGVLQQPFVSCPALRNVQISISHCGEWGLALAFPEAVAAGIDLEHCSPRLARIVDEHATLCEREAFLGHAPASDASACLLWTMKEALSKALRTGLTLPLELLEVQSVQAEGQTYSCTYTYFPQYRALAFPAGDYVVAIAYPRDLKLQLEPDLIRRRLQTDLRGAPPILTQGRMKE